MNYNWHGCTRLLSLGDRQHGIVSIEWGSKTASWPHDASHGRVVQEEEFMGCRGRSSGGKIRKDLVKIFTWRFYIRSATLQQQFPFLLAMPMDHIENLQQAYLRLAERVWVTLQIHVGDATQYQQLCNGVLKLCWTGQWQSNRIDQGPDPSYYQNQLPGGDFISLQESVNTMIECLHTAENKTMDPPAPGLQVNCRVKGKVGWPCIEWNWQELLGECFACLGTISIGTGNEVQPPDHQKAHCQIWSQEWSTTHVSYCSEPWWYSFSYMGLIMHPHSFSCHWRPWCAGWVGQGCTAHFSKCWPTEVGQDPKSERLQDSQGMAKGIIPTHTWCSCTLRKTSDRKMNLSCASS